jgi:hypothetical protein
MTDKVNSNLIRSLLATGLLVLLVACAGQEAKTSTEKEEKPSQVTQDENTEKGIKGTLLIFAERESASDKESFTTRIFVSDEYLHMSNSYSPADFVLLNRSEQTIYNVNRDDKSIFVIKNKPYDMKPPIDINYEVKSQPSNAIPKIDGRQATHYRFYANDKHCYDSVVLGDDFLPDVLAAMREFRQVLAGEHAATVNKIPLDMLDACDLSLNVFHATKHMEHGFPIREWDRKGYQRFLVDYRQDVSVPKEIFDLPKDFTQYTLEDMQSGKVR